MYIQPSYMWQVFSKHARAQFVYIYVNENHSLICDYIFIHIGGLFSLQTLIGTLNLDENAVFQPTLLNAFSWQKILIYLFKCNCILFQSTIKHNRFNQWLDAEQMTCLCLNQSSSWQTQCLFVLITTRMIHVFVLYNFITSISLSCKHCGDGFICFIAAATRSSTSISWTNPNGTWSVLP